MEKEQEKTKLVTGEIADHWWWAGAGAVQCGLGTFVVRRGYSGNPRRMPYAAFAVASLFVGAAASAAMASLLASGIHSVEDMNAVGEGIRASLGLQPRPRKG